MSEIIKINPNKDGRAIATIYGKDFDLTEMADENGKGTFKAFGNEYQFAIKKSRKNTVKGVKKPITDAAKAGGEGSAVVDSEESEE